MIANGIDITMISDDDLLCLFAAAKSDQYIDWTVATLKNSPDAYAKKD